ncbi:dihydrofolate reductase-like domain-containing protein [Podospora aff. communis PSN243]|uniref:2,5-diamino-6-ribosylamino-4(3H)-pyrimidinone 5'-phosphate reductase n=1 Tax=Podospora aff. communis PSN243 TaxID=3040156 RepID=A0AAV9G4W2_9PEZI|nr:dihydrofolate reductase-like domain-containing protein [Podospora aff. communis PSN243]
MRTVRYNFATTLDGFIASQDHSTHWIVEDPTIDFDALYAEFSTFVMGRKTYEVLLKYGNPLAGWPKEAVVVVSGTMKPEEHPHATIECGDVVSCVRRLREGEGKDIWVMGGGQLVGLLMEAGLVDVIEAAVMPVVIGEGVPMVSGLGRDVKLKLEGVTQLKESGILMTRYRVLPRQPPATASR